ncbi:Helicase associated domain protein [Streptomyces sp. 21So2-11]|uniref:Helicase associated domain protein n=1 Tax=Streptomyces sp. 21So2-11 TaxID=3144408 RepID=UPI00321B229E
MAAAQLALFKAREDHEIRRTVVFSNSTVQSDTFAETLPQTAAAIPGRHTEGLWAASIHHRTRRRERRDHLTRFAETPHPPRTGQMPDLSVLCNIRLCVEGVDFPLADSVLFSTPKQSTIDIVQAIGRALRLGPGMNKTSTLIIPVFFGPGQRAEEATFGTPYHLLHQVMIALKAYDEHYFYRLPVGGTRLLLPTPAAAVRPARAPEIAPHLMLRIMEPEPDVWESGMAGAQHFFDTHGHLNVPSNHITPDGFHLGCWLGYQRTLKTAGNLSAPRTAALATCNMRWAHGKDSAETLLESAQAYAREHGHLLPEATQTYQGRPLGRWLTEQRRAARETTLPAPYARALTDIDPWWNPAWPPSWQRLCARARTHPTPLTIPTCPLPRNADGLTRWLDEQFDVFPLLAKGQQTQLAALALQHDPLALALHRPHSKHKRAHNDGLRAARRFYRSHQHLRVPADYVDDHAGASFPLGQWIADVREMAAGNHLSPEEIRSLEALAMQWVPDPQGQDTSAPVNKPPQDATTPSRLPTPLAVAVPRTSDRGIWIAGTDARTPGVMDVVHNGGRRGLLSLPAGAGTTAVTAAMARELASPACLVLGPDRIHLRHVAKTWRMHHQGPIAAVNMSVKHGSKQGGTTVTSARELADWAARQPPGAVVVARYDDAELIARSHHDHRLPPWDHLIIEEAHRTAEGTVDRHHPHALIHYDDGILAYTRLYLTATPIIPHHLPMAGETEAVCAVNMTAQRIFGTLRPSVDRPQLVDDGVLSPYQVIRIPVSEPAGLPLWRAKAIGTAHVIEQHNLRRVVAVLPTQRQAEAFGSQLAVRMLDAEIVVPPWGAVRYKHNQPVIRCQRVSDPMPADLDAVVLPSSDCTTVELVNALRPLMGQHAERAAQTAIVMPESAPNAGAPPAEPPALLRRILAAVWAHDPNGQKSGTAPLRGFDRRTPA